MEDDGDNLFDICKAFYENDKNIKEKKIDGLFQKMDKNDYNKNVKKISYEKIYIVDKMSIEDIMNKLNFSEYESLLNGQDNKNNDDKIKKKIINFMENNPSLKIKDDLQKIQFYSTYDEVKDVFNNNKSIYFLKEEYLKALGIQEKSFKGKFIYFSKLEYMIFFKFNESLDFLLINITDKKKDGNNIDENKGLNKKNNIINDKDEKNDEDEKNEEKDEVRNNLNKNINIITHHLNFLDSINELNSIDAKDLNDLTHIKKTLFDSNETELSMDCFLVESEIFNKFEEEIYYNDCESISLTKEEDNKEIMLNITLIYPSKLIKYF